MLFWSLVSAVAAGLAGFLGRKLLKLSSVQASAAIALLAGVTLPQLSSEGAYLAAVCMHPMQPCRLKDGLHPLQMAGVSGLCGLIAYVGRDCLVGVGGRLGTCGRRRLIFAGGMRAGEQLQLLRGEACSSDNGIAGRVAVDEADCTHESCGVACVWSCGGGS